MVEWLLVVGAGSVQQAVIRRAKAMGFRVVATDADPHAPGLAVADAAAVVDVTDVEGTMRVAESHRVSGVLSVSVEAAVVTVATVAERLGLPGLPLAAAEKATDKRKMREALQRAGVPVPRWVACSTAEEAMSALDRFPAPLVVKPADSSGSRGVSLASSRSGIEAAFERAISFSRRGMVLVEEFVEGPEVSVEGFVVGRNPRVLALSDKVRTPPPYLLDTAVYFPSSHGSEVKQRIREIAEAAVGALGIEQAPFHIEVLLGSETPVIVEVAARGPGFKVFTEILPWVTGVDVLEQSIHLATGRPVDMRSSENRAAAVAFPSASPGRVRRIAGLEAARSIKGIHEIELHVSAGDMIRPLTSGSDRIGHVIALAEERDVVERELATALEYLQITVDPDESQIRHRSTNLSQEPD